MPPADVKANKAVCRQKKTLDHKPCLLSKSCIDDDEAKTLLQTGDCALLGCIFKFYAALSRFLIGRTFASAEGYFCCLFVCFEGFFEEIIYLSLHCHHQNDFCIKMGSDESHFNVSIGSDGQNHKTVSTNHNRLGRERRAEAESSRGPSAYQPNALPLGQTGSPSDTHGVYTSRASKLKTGPPSQFTFRSF